jgi:hypothetical protein
MTKEVTEMKKILFLTTMVLAVSFGTAYADHGSGVWDTGDRGYQPKNGITVFCSGPAIFDSIPLATKSARASYYEESSAAGGIRVGETTKEPYNGVTVFSYGPVAFDSIPLEAGAMGVSYEESSAAVGLRAGEWAGNLNNNGITDFTGRTYDTISAGTE